MNAVTRRARARSPAYGSAFFATLVTALLAAAAGDAQADGSEQPDTSWIDFAALDSREVQALTARDDRPLTVRVKAAAKVKAPARAIWDVLVACQIAPEYVPNVVSCESLEKVDDGRAELFIQTVKPAFFLPTFEHVFRLDYEPYERIGVHRVSGPLETMEGAWWLLPQPDGAILLVYELAVNPGMPAPRFFVRSTMKRDIPRMVMAVRDRAERAAADDTVGKL